MQECRGTTTPGVKEVSKEDHSGELGEAQRGKLRRLIALLNFVSQDRPDISFAAKELCREFAVPNKTSFAKLKRLVRYLCGLSRLVYEYPFLDRCPDVLDIFVDTDFAGCAATRRSTSGGAIMLGPHCIRHWSATQTTISLSSGEAELHGIAKGISQAIGMQSLCKDLGWNYKLRVHSDASAAIGIARRRGLGKIRHLDVEDLWVQSKVRDKVVDLVKVAGVDNPADILTKYVDRSILEKMLQKLGMKRLEGRSAAAPMLPPDT